MRHEGTKRLETKRLLLRQFHKEDADAMFCNWTSDESVTNYLRWSAHKTIDTTKQIVEQWIRNYQRANYYQWAIVLKQEPREVIGSISVVKQDEELDIVHIGYCIGRSWWHQGYTSEALTRILSFFFEEVGVHRVESWHDPDNVNSGSVMKKCGMQYEGTLRQADRNNHGIVDAVVYSMLIEEYNERENDKIRWR